MAEQFRITVFGQPRSDWRDSADEAMQDAIGLGLAARDGRAWYLPVPAVMERRGAPEQADLPYPARQPPSRSIWTGEDLETLRRIAADQGAALTASLFLGRSRMAVIRKAKALGLTLRR